MYKQDLALNNLQLLICHKIQPVNQPQSATHSSNHFCNNDEQYISETIIKNKLLERLKLLPQLSLDEACFELPAVLQIATWA